MKRLILGRIIQVIPVLIMITFVSFWMLSVLPGDQSILLLGTQVPPELQVQLREELHLDDPVLVRYGLWLGDMVQGDFGFSWRYSEDVGPLLWQAWKNTALLASVSAVFSLTVGTAAGALAGAAWRRSQSRQSRRSERQPPAFFVLRPWQSSFR